MIFQFVVVNYSFTTNHHEQFHENNTSKTMSFVKKNIKRKHEEDHILNDVLAYKNLYEIEMTLKIDDDRVKKINQSIDK